MSRTPHHLKRLETAVANLPNDRAREIARKLDATLAPHAVFWGAEEDGTPYIEWGGAKPGEEGPPYLVRLYGF